MSVKEGEGIHVPKTWKQLIHSPDKQKWMKSMGEELRSLIGNEIWRLVPHPIKRKIIRSKWVHKVKHKSDGSIDRLKSRLVAMVFTQVKGIDYNEVFAPTTRLETLRLVLTLLESKRWSGRQVDFKTAFLNGKLSEPVYMTQPPGFKDNEHPDWVCELTRSIYGLKQSPREWNKELHQALISIGLTQSSCNPTLYFKVKERKLQGAVTVHVDDLAVVGEDHFVDFTIKALGEKFKIGAESDLHHFLSLALTQDVENQVIYLSQEQYIKDVCRRFLSSASTKCTTPTNNNFKDLKYRTKDKEKAPPEYPAIIGSLLWVARCTRPDTSCPVKKLSQFLKDPSISHRNAAIRVLQYLHSTSHL